jgi:SAM-dependent methyltransferase
MLDQLAAGIRRHPTLARPARTIRRQLTGWRRPSPGATAPTIAQHWDAYAQQYRASSSSQLGDEWNKPAALGVDVPADQIVPMLDEKVFSPFLGYCTVMLEIGPGGGRFTEILLPKCEHLIAADTSAAMLDLLRDRFSSAGPKLQSMLLDGKGLSAIDDASVDAAFSYGVFVHLQHWDIFNYLCELERVLKPGGRAIIQHPNTFSALGWQKFLIDLPRSLNTHKLARSFSVMTPELMNGFVQRAGLRVERFVEDIIPRDCITLLTRPE